MYFFWSWICTIGYIWWWTYCLYGLTWTSYMIHLRNISDFCLQSASRSYANACVNVFQRLSTTYIPSVVQRIVNSTFHSSVEYSQLGYMLKFHYILCLLSLRFFHGHDVPVGCLLTSQTLALCPRWLYFTVEWIRGVNTYVVPRQTSVVDIGGTSATVE